MKNQTIIVSRQVEERLRQKRLAALKKAFALIKSAPEEIIPNFGSPEFRASLRK
jgi:hypothetical protein